MRIFCIACAMLCAVAQAATAATKTAVLIYNPWVNGALRSGLVAAEKITGTCWENSLSTDRKNAWRCMTATSSIYDPCFSTPANPRLVACTDNPFGKRVSLMTLKQPLKLEAKPYVAMLQPEGEPWALRLTTGEICSFETGATDAIKGMRLNYQCQGGFWIVGFPDRSKPAWSAYKSVFPKNRRLSTVGIASAVF